MKLKLCVRFALTLFVWVLLFSVKSVFAVMLAVLLHEAAHILACRSLGVQVLGMTPLPWGVTITTPLVYDIKAQIYISLAGPACNFFCLAVCMILKILFKTDSEFFDIFMLASLADGALNLLPVLPLDGGIVLKSKLCAAFGLANGFSGAMTVTTILGTALTILGIWIFFATGYNFSYVAAGLFVLVNLKHERELLMCIKKRVFTGEIKSAPKIKCITVDASCHALCLANLISCAHTLVFLVNKDGKFQGEVSQNRLIKCLFENSLITIGECIEKF